MSIAPLFQASLFGAGPLGVDHSTHFDRIPLDEMCWLDFGRNWLHGADDLLADLASSLPLARSSRPMYGRLVDDPRVHAPLTDDDVDRRPVLGEMRDGLEARYGTGLAPGFVNYYQDGNDSVAWHADRIGVHQVNPIVAIVSLGGPRRFYLRPMGGGPAFRLVLASGDLVVMGGACQHAWEHTIPKMANAEPRMSISYRHVEDVPHDRWWYRNTASE